MSRFVRTLALAILVLVVMSAPRVALAQPIDTILEQQSAELAQAAQANGGIDVRAAVDDAVQTARDVAGAAGRVVGNGILGAVLSPIAIVSYVILTISSFFLWLSGMLFNFAVFVLVFEFAKYFGNSPGLLIGWAVLRDFGNIILLFGFVYIGIQTILNIGHFSVGKALPRLIIFAVLLNFSLFVAEAIIDGSNLLAAGIYANSSGEQCSEGPGRTFCMVNGGVSGHLLNVSGVGTVIGFGGFDGNANTDPLRGLGSYFSNPIPSIINFVGLAIFVTVAWVVLLAGSFLLISRAIMLAFLMVTSPIGFAGMTLPVLNGLAKQWWHQLINNAFFAPVFLLLLFVSLKIAEGAAAISPTPGGRPNLSEAISSGNTGLGGSILLFALIIGFFVASLIIAKNFGVIAADKIVGGAAGAPGMLGRNTFGRFANYQANKWRLDPRVANSRFGQRLIGGAESIAGFSFHPGSMGGDKVFGKPSDASKKGYAGRVKAYDEQQEKYASATKKVREKNMKELEATPEMQARKKAIRDAKIAGNTDRADRLTKEYEKIIEDKRKSWLSPQEKDEYEDLKRDEKTAAGTEEAASEAAQKAADALDGLREAAKSAETRFKELSNERHNPATTPERQAEIDEEMRELEERRNLLNEQIEAGVQTRNTAQKQVKAAKEVRKELQEMVKDMGSHKYAMQQWAKTQDKGARSLSRFIPIGPNASMMRSAASSIRAETAKDPVDSAFDHLKHELMHGKEHEAHDDHGDEDHGAKHDDHGGDDHGGDAHAPAGGAH